MCKKRNDKESMICLTPKPSEKKFETIPVFLWPPSSPHLKPLDYDSWGSLENKTNVTFHPNIGSLQTAIEMEWNKISEEFILKACKSFRRRVDTITKKMWPY